MPTLRTIDPRRARVGGDAARTYALTLLLLSAASAACAATLTVSPNGPIATIAQAARVARDDDIVEIAAGTYRGDVAVWRQKRLTIRGIGGTPVLSAKGQIAEGKAIWVIRDGDFTIENVPKRLRKVGDLWKEGMRRPNRIPGVTGDAAA